MHFSAHCIDLMYRIKVFFLYNQIDYVDNDETDRRSPRTIVKREKRQVGEYTPRFNKELYSIGRQTF